VPIAVAPRRDSAVLGGEHAEDTALRWWFKAPRPCSRLPTACLISLSKNLNLKSFFYSPTDEDDQDGHFFYNHPERGAYSAA